MYLTNEMYLTKRSNFKDKNTDRQKVFEDARPMWCWCTMFDC